jgi:hypothetical protein
MKMRKDVSALQTNFGPNIPALSVFIQTILITQRNCVLLALETKFMISWLKSVYLAQTIDQFLMELNAFLALKINFLTKLCKNASVAQQDCISINSKRLADVNPKPSGMDTHVLLATIQNILT